MEPEHSYFLPFSYNILGREARKFCMTQSAKTAFFIYGGIFCADSRRHTTNIHNDLIRYCRCYKDCFQSAVCFIRVHLIIICFKSSK